ncbi:high mobility group box domain-containing protein [Mucor mucedo]|uniref:high mobility group box domain-containing protein n=1 Tax=Mucor mucedo TaxID=29922 RepID=UPI00221EBED5|nr:high mobility group box domain-containing protein [Mucor mucedo]KAI7878370.1 high mobility group box domain-containing protein [Mucor mucedo]
MEDIKLDDLKKRFRTVEQENDLLQEKLLRAQKSIKRLRLERTLLLDRIDKGYDGMNTNSDSDTGSDLLLHNDLDKNIYKQHNKHPAQPNNTTVIKPPKKKKDPNAPKGPGNVFFLFCRLERDKIKDENPEENIGDVTKLLGLKWKALPKEEKQIYYDTFKKEMEEYEEAMKTYKSSGLSLDQAESSASSPHHHQIDQHVHLPAIANLIDTGLQNIMPKDSWTEPISLSPF